MYKTFERYNNTKIFTNSLIFTNLLAIHFTFVIDMCSRVYH